MTSTERTSFRLVEARTSTSVADLFSNVAPVGQPYIDSMSDEYFSRTTRRFSFSDGVISPLSGVQASGTITNFLTCSTLDTSWLAASSAAWISALTSGRRLKAARSRIVHPVLTGPDGCLFRVEGDDHRQVLPPVTDHAGLGHEWMVLERRLQLGRGDVLAGGIDDDLLLATNDEEEAVVVETTRDRRNGASPPGRKLRRSPAAPGSSRR